MKKSINRTKSRIVAAAWELFYLHGYENTTIDDIVERSNTSKGSFYHYFKSKESLMNSLAYLFDEKYTELMDVMDPQMSPVEKLLYINKELFLMIENSIPVSMVTQLLAAQILTKEQRSLLDQERVYFKLVRQIVVEAKEKDIFNDGLSVSDIVRAYAFYERALMYDWCMSGGSYSLCQYSQQMMPMFLDGISK